MKDMYRGVPLPKVERDGDWYYIADDEYGWFEGYSRMACLQAWKNKVDTIQRRDLLGEGKYILQDSGAIMCARCGSVVLDLHLHETGVVHT